MHFTGRFNFGFCLIAEALIELLRWRGSRVSEFRVYRRLFGNYPAPELCPSSTAGCLTRKEPGYRATRAGRAGGAASPAGPGGPGAW